MAERKHLADRSKETYAQWRRRRGDCAVPNNVDLARWKRLGCLPDQDSDGRGDER